MPTFQKVRRRHEQGIQEDQYALRPLIDGQLNLVYFEQIADGIGRKGEQVKYGLVELLPGAYIRSRIWD